MPCSQKRGQGESLIVEAKGICYSYDSFSLKDLTFDINEGEYISLLGSNGSGKSTLLRILDLILPLKSGTLRLFSIDSKEIKKANDIRRNISFIFQNPTSSIINKVVLDEVMFAPLNYGVDEKEAKKAAIEELERFGLSGYEKRNVFELSNGERQRLSIASAFVTKPKLLILDEAFSYLDNKSKEMLINAIDAERKKGTAIISVSHDARVAKLTDRIILLKNGQIVKDGKSSVILSDIPLLIDSNIKPLDEDLFSWSIL